MTSSISLGSSSLASFALLLAAALAGCGPGEAATTSGSGSGGSGGAGSSGGSGTGGDPCPPGSHTAGSAVCAADLTEWTEGPSLGTRRDHHVSFALESESGTFLYAAGGVTDLAALLKSIERAPIAADGSLGPWEKIGDLPQAAGGPSIATDGTTVIVAGGHRGAGPTVRTDIATADGTGALTWKQGPDMAHKRFHGASIAVHHIVYAVGGLTDAGKTNTPSVEALDVAGPDPIPWAPLTPLPDKRSHHGLAATEDALYVTGGLEGDPAGLNTPYDDVLRAPIEADGKLGEWTVAGKLPSDISTHASFVHLGQLYVLGGISEEDPNYALATVWRAPILEDGSIGEWQALPDLPKDRSHGHQAPVVGGFIYVPGGAIEHKSYADVFIGRFE